MQIFWCIRQVKTLIKFKIYSEVHVRYYLPLQYLTKHMKPWILSIQHICGLDRIRLLLPIYLYHSSPLQAIVSLDFRATARTLASHNCVARVASFVSLLVPVLCILQINTKYIYQNWEIIWNGSEFYVYAKCVKCRIWVYLTVCKILPANALNFFRNCQINWSLSSFNNTLCK